MRKAAAESERRGASSIGSIVLTVVPLAAFGFQPAISLWADNYALQPHPRRLLFVSCVAVAVAVAAVAATARALGAPRAGSIVSVVLFGFFGWSSLRGIARPEGYTPQLAENVFPALVIGALLLVAWRYGARRGFRTVVLTVALATLGSSLGSLAFQAARLRPARLPAGALVGDATEGARKPDVFFIVLDAYAGRDVLSDVYGFDNRPFLSELRRRGFALPARAAANYSMTYAAVAAALSLDYPVLPPRFVGRPERLGMYELMGGRSTVVRSLKAAGYRYVHLEGGWGGTQCGPAVDRCIAAPFLDEGPWARFQRTPLAGLMRMRYGHSMTINATDRLRRLEGLARAREARPRFVFAHVLLPHAPLFLDAGCRRRVDADLDGTTIAATFDQTLLARRRAAYADQVRCVNGRILKTVDAMPSDAIVVLTGDHGPDSSYQLRTPLGTWTRPMIRERMSIMSAYRVPPACGRAIYPEITPVNGMRVVLGCALGTELPRARDRHFLVPAGVLGPTVEVDPR